MSLTVRLTCFIVRAVAEGMVVSYLAFLLCLWKGGNEAIGVTKGGRFPSFLFLCRKKDSHQALWAS
jgi:hypothetical protein